MTVWEEFCHVGKNRHSKVLLSSVMETKSEFAVLRERAGLSIEEAADIFRVSPRSAYRYESGESAPAKLVIDILEMMAEANQKPVKDASFRFIDLFAGIGGLRVGFENIGGKCVFTSE